MEMKSYQKQEQKKVLSLCLDLICKPIKGKVRFVPVIDGGETFILMCSDLSLSPLRTSLKLIAIVLKSKLISRFQNI